MVRKKNHSALPAASKCFHTCSQQCCYRALTHWTHLQLWSNYPCTILHFGLLICLLAIILLFKGQTPPLTWADGEMSSLVLRGALTNVLTGALNRAEACRATYALWHGVFLCMSSAVNNIGRNIHDVTCSVCQLLTYYAAQAWEQRRVENQRPPSFKFIICKIRTREKNSRNWPN